MKLPVALLLIAGISITQVQGSKKVFCYYSSFTQTRPGVGEFLPENIDPSLCTHVIYAFVDISDDGRNLTPFNWNDITPGTGLYARTLALKRKNPKLKVLLAVGGWIIGSEPFIPMVASSKNRRIWIENVIKYLRKLQGLYTAFESEAEKTGQDKLLLTLATASGSYYINKSYEPHKIINYVDYMLLMTYNYHGQWEKVTGHHSGMWRHHKDPPGEKSELNTVKKPKKKQQKTIDIFARNIVKNNFAGAFVWSLEMDDFSGSCNEGKSPLMNTIRNVLQPYGPSRVEISWGQKSSIGRIHVTGRHRSSNRPRITVKPKPAWKEKPTWKPRPTWFKQTKKLKYATRNKLVIKPTKQPSAAGSVDCSKLGEGIYLDPTSCEHFVHCIYGGGHSYYSVKMKCPEGTLFDRDLGICNHRTNVIC
eukprot:XP_014773537.1 PREDICTED: acidic mammalian chitinase-like [Octopus bimaculoides]